MKRTLLGEPCLSWVERRRSPRLDAPHTLRVELLTGDMPLRLRDVSSGGFLVATRTAFAPGTQHTFRFLSGGWVSRPLTAVSVHSKPDQQNPSWFQTGFAFEGHPDGVAELVDHVTSSLTFL